MAVPSLPLEMLHGEKKRCICQTWHDNNGLAQRTDCDIYHDMLIQSHTHWHSQTLVLSRSHALSDPHTWLHTHTHANTHEHSFDVFTYLQQTCKRREIMRQRMTNQLTTLISVFQVFWLSPCMSSTWCFDKLYMWTQAPDTMTNFTRELINIFSTSILKQASRTATMKITTPSYRMTNKQAVTNTVNSIATTSAAPRVASD